MNKTFSGSAVSSLTSGDAVIVIECWARVTQGLATSYTYGFYFDGRISQIIDEADATDMASYVQTPENLSLSDSYAETKLYLHDTTTGIPTGTLPNAEQSYKDCNCKL